MFLRVAVGDNDYCNAVRFSLEILKDAVMEPGFEVTLIVKQRVVDAIFAGCIVHDVQRDMPGGTAREYADYNKYLSDIVVELVKNPDPNQDNNGSTGFLDIHTGYIWIQ